jgi:hypothetical protein
MLLREVMATQCIERVLQAVDAGSNNIAGKLFYQQ